MVEENFDEYNPKEYLRGRIAEGREKDIGREKLLSEIDTAMTEPKETTFSSSKIERNERNERRSLVKSIKKQIASSAKAKLAKILRERKAGVRRQSTVKRLFGAVSTIGVKPQYPKSLSSIERMRKLKRLQMLQQKKIISGYNTNLKEVVSNHNLMREQQELGDRQRSKKLSQNTQAMLQQLLRTQTKSSRDDGRTQRILRERKILESSSGILSAPFIFNKYQFDVAGVDDKTNILMAPNIFKHDELKNPSIMKSNRPSILQAHNLFSKNSKMKNKRLKF